MCDWRPFLFGLHAPAPAHSGTRTPWEAVQSCNLPQEWLKGLWFGQKNFLRLWLNRVELDSFSDIWWLPTLPRLLSVTMIQYDLYIAILAFQTHVFFMMLQGFWPLIINIPADWKPVLFFTPSCKFRQCLKALPVVAMRSLHNTCAFRHCHWRQ